jgi:flagellar basal body P-ring formation protein FlgA
MIRKIFVGFLLLAGLPAMLLLAGSAFADTTFGTSARAIVSAKIVVPARDIMRGEVLGESDLTFADAPAGVLATNTVTKFDALVGMQTRRALRTGESLRPDDVRRPVIVIKGQTVTMRFSAPGVELTAMGRAMSEGGVGDTVTVQNPVSFRMINAVVEGAGTVRVADPSLPSTTATARK